jgi:uncharacterized protein
MKFKEKAFPMLLVLLCVPGLALVAASLTNGFSLPSIDKRAAVRSAAYPMTADASFAERLTAAAMERTSREVEYDPAYVRIPYPGGDVPAGKGVCTDVVIRSYRTLGIDLQKLVHEDMRAHFAKYPKKWGLPAPDANIDHRRVPNLTAFFKRKGKALAVTMNPDDYKPGDLATWKIPGNLDHIGIVVKKRGADGKRRMIVHNIGAGPKCEDILFAYKITGHLRYEGP